jgi:outer membrane receptor for ferrienterochelin and colicin
VRVRGLFEQPEVFEFLMKLHYFSLIFLVCPLGVRGQEAQPSPSPAATVSGAQHSGGSQELNNMTVVGQLNEARESIVPELGATRYEINKNQIATELQGSNAPFNEVLLRAPGVAQDSFGQLHIRGEHANLQYRINDILIPEGISGFGQELDSRFAQNVSLITGSLPAQFGFRTAGIVDVHTKDGVLSPGGSVSLYGGAQDTIRPSIEYAGSSGKFSYYLTGSFNQNDLGIENPTNSHNAIHDDTTQYKGFAYLSYLIDDTSRITLTLSGTYSTFQIPNNPGQVAAFTYKGQTVFDSRQLNENQYEQNHYAVLAYQKAFDWGGFQLAAFTRYSGIDFSPDIKGDLMFNGTASHVARTIFSNGVQLDANWVINDSHTLRGGFLVTAETAKIDTTTAVFPTDPFGNQASDIPFSIVDNHRKTGYLYGFYLQDEWKVFAPLTINFGARFDLMSEFTHSSQLSPRVNAVLQLTSTTTVHAGYSRYFTPPPIELVGVSSLQKFIGTTNQAAVQKDSVIKPERSHYFDAGITQKITDGLTVGVDGYYKIARDQLDEGQFGAALIFSPFNYSKGNVYGVEVTANYTKGGFSAYANFAFSRATGQKITSSQFLFGADELKFISNHWIFLDHDQRYTLSAGASYKFRDTTVYADLLYGSGLRNGFASTQNLPGYYPVNVGLQHDFHLPNKNQIQVRFDIVNLFDQAYELRDGTGVGVGAPQWGQRRGFYGGVSWVF